MIQKGNILFWNSICALIERNKYRDVCVCVVGVFLSNKIPPLRKLHPLPCAHLSTTPRICFSLLCRTLLGVEKGNPATSAKIIYIKPLKPQINR